jgi:hypothetical protein
MTGGQAIQDILDRDDQLTDHHAHRLVSELVRYGVPPIEAAALVERIQRVEADLRTANQFSDRGE